jgi:adenylate cyclase
MSLAGDARAAGATALAQLRLSMAERTANLLKTEPDLVANAVEVGLLDRNWLEEPGHHPVSTTPPLDIVKRFLERSVERHPSALASLGLTAIEVLSWPKDEQAGDGPGVAAQLTIVFTDLEGFTRYTAREGDDAASQLLLEHHRRIGPVVRGRGGRVVKRLGDGLLLSFPEPEAAVLAAVELIDTAPDPLRLRAGAHLGEVIVTRDDLIGHVVNVAARVTESARGGEVLVTRDVREAVRGLRGVTFGRARRRNFKGVGEVVHVCPVAPDPRQPE